MHRSSSATLVSSSSEFLNHSSSSSSLSSSSPSQTFKPLSISSDQTATHIQSPLPGSQERENSSQIRRDHCSSHPTLSHPMCLRPLVLLQPRIEGLTVDGDIDNVGPRSSSVSDLKPGNFKSAKPLAEADPQD